MTFRAFHAAESGRTPPPGTVRDCLIVDDDPVSRHALARQLTGYGVRVREACAAEPALDIWQQWRPAAVLIDCVLPGWDGYQLADSIRTLERCSSRNDSSLLIAVSGRSDPAHWRRCEMAGMDGAVSKPARAADYMRWLGLEIPAGAGPNPSRKLQEAELHCLYASSCTLDLHTLFAALASGQDEQVRRHAHRIEGASFVAGAIEVATEARSLGEAVRAGLGEVELASRAAALDDAFRRWQRRHQDPDHFDRFPKGAG